MRHLAIAWFLFSITSAFGQFSNERCKWVKEFNAPVTLDSLSIVPESISVKQADGVRVVHNLSSGVVTFNRDVISDSILVCYKVLPFSFHQKFFHRDLSIYDSGALFKDPVVGKNPSNNREELFKTPELNKSGSISRGISFGNNQDVFVNSTLNLNLDGKLTDDLNIRAAITDQNVPYQPEGNTQQLQDFDNVFIEIYNDNFLLRGGDIVLKNPTSNFLRFYKNVQGGQANVEYKLSKNGKARTSAGISVAKGRFASVQIEPIEGSLGPYRIQGPNNELFIIVLANSERVFLDGVQLERGFNKDYIIDYNIGEIAFTNRILITEFSRIRVDYEFSDQNFSRTIATASHEQKIGKAQFFVHTYGESDNRNRPLQIDLTDGDKQFLSTIGDDLTGVVSSGADSVEFSNELILYSKIDTVDLDGNAQEVFQYSTDPERAHFRVTFSEIGAGNGNYIQAESTANGRVFQWVSPQNGTMQGQFEPVQNLPVPNKKQMTTVGTNYEVTENEEVFAEMALSVNDLNLYSEIDSDDDKGYAFKVGLKSRDRNVKILPEYKMNAYFDFEYDDSNFNPIDRFRYIEFDRDWSYDPATDQRRFEDNIFNAGLELSKNDGNLIKYDVTRRVRGDQVNGYQHRLRLDQRGERLLFKSTAYFMDSDVPTHESSWKRYSTELGYKLPWIVPGYIFNLDQNRVVSNETDSVVSSAMYFTEHIGYLRSRAEHKGKFDLRYSYREDKRPLNGELRNFSSAHTTRMSYSKSFKSNRLNAILIYRQLALVSSEDVEETVSGRIDWSGNWFDKHVRSEVTYSVANSREVRREFVYIKVPPGQGTHTWRDLNEDGVQDLTEFFEAVNPDERNYAKIFTPSNTFIAAFQNLFIYRVSIDMPRKWKSVGGIKSFLSRISNNTSFTSDVKTTDSELEARLLSFIKESESESLLSERRNLRSTTFFNRANSTFGVEGVYVNQVNRQLLTNGFELRSFMEYALNIRLNFSKQYNVRLKSASSLRKADSDFLAGRQFRIESYRLNPEFSWQPGLRFRLTFQYNHTNKQNTFSPENDEFAEFDEGIVEVKYNKAIQSSLNARFRMININFRGDENTPLGYELLDALRPGTNYTWSLNWQQKILSGLQLNLIYDGRKSEGNDIIHVGRVQVSALF